MNIMCLKNKNVAGYITRNQMLYKSGVEYADYAMNHVKGCAHGCRYPCYAYMNAHRYGRAENYEVWLQPYLVSNTLELLAREIPRLKNNIKSVTLSFTCDAFMYGYDEICKMSLDAITMLNNAGIKCITLTKGVLPYALAYLAPYNEYGISISSLNEEYRRNMEPGAAPFIERIISLKALHDAGCRTWVSIEPYPTPNIIGQDLMEILNAIGFVDRIVFGKMNYNASVKEYNQYKEFYNQTAIQVIAFCNARGIEYHIKDRTIS